MTLSSVLAVAGCISLFIGIFGGGIRAKDFEIPKISRSLSILLDVIGVLLIGIAIWLSLPPNTTSQIPTETAYPIYTPAQISPTVASAQPVILTPTLNSVITSTFTLEPTFTLVPPTLTATLTPTLLSIQNILTNTLTPTQLVVSSGPYAFTECKDGTVNKDGSSNQCCCFIQSHIHMLEQVFPKDTRIRISWRAGTPGGVCRSDTATFSVSLHGNTWDELGTAFVEGRTTDDTLHKMEYVASEDFQYVKVEIPKCYNDYSSVEVNW